MAQRRAALQSVPNYAVVALMDTPSPAVEACVPLEAMNVVNLRSGSTNLPPAGVQRCSTARELGSRYQFGWSTVPGGIG
eukprot:180661-Amphidinium_carterae.2